MEMITYSQILEKAQERNLSLNQLAHRANVARSVLDRWRTGKSAPTLRTIEKLYQALDSHSAKQEV